MLADSYDLPRHLADGQSYKFLVDRDSERCVQFVSLEGMHSTHLLLAAENISSVEYKVLCYGRAAW